MKVLVTFQISSSTFELRPEPAHLDGSVEEHPGAIQEAENREDRVDGEEEELDPEPEAGNSKKTLLRFEV